MKSNKRISAGKRTGNPGYRTASTFRFAVKFKNQAKSIKNPPK